MKTKTPLIVLALIASAARLSGAARSADHHIWAKQPREITSNSLLDLQDNDEPVIGGDGGGGGAKDTASDFTTRLLRQRVSELPDLRNIRSSLAVLFETAVNEFFGSFLPALSRVRREARDEGKSGGYQEADYLDTIVTGMGALMDRQSCRLRVTCNAGKVIQNNVPGAQVAVMLLESLMPHEWLPWYGTVKTSVIDRSDNCAQQYTCELLPEEPKPNK